MQRNTTLALFAAALAIIPSATSQTQTAQLTGTITDQTGAVVPAVNVSATHIETGLKRDAESNNLGIYTVPLLPPGTYRISVQKTGFKPLTRAGVELQIAQVARIDFVLDVGAVTENVEVTAETPLLAQETSSLGQVIDNAKIVNMPLNGRSSFRLLQLTPSILTSPSASGMFGDIAVNQGDETRFSINGGRYNQNEVLIDGVPSTAGSGNSLTVVPSVDSTQEFKVQSSNMSAEWGRFGGGVLNVSTKSGTNLIHGSVFEFLRNSYFDANEFFNKTAGRDIPPFRLNQFGFAAGGPVWLSKLYDGRNKTFFFTDYQGTRWRRGDVFIGSVPTALERSGDFSETRTTQGQLINMYDPFDTRSDPNRPGQHIRSVFPGNRIPSSRFDPIALKMISYYPAPNVAGVPFTNQNNYISNAPRKIDQVVWGVRVDHNIGDKQRLFARWGVMRSTLAQPDTYGNVASAGVGANGEVHLYGYNGTLSSSTTLRPNLLLELKYGFARFHWDRPSRSYGFDPTALGFPAAQVRQYQLLNFPPISVEGINGLSGGSYLDTNQNTHSFMTSLMWMRGRHSLKFGTDIRILPVSSLNNGSPSGNFNFPRSFTRGPDPNVFTANSGSGFASFLLGAANTGQILVAPALNVITKYFGGFIQDDIRVNSRFTLNVGLRYEVESPMTERFNQLARFDYNLASPARNAQFPNLAGGLNFAKPGDRDAYPWDYNNIAPRLGFAYTMMPKTVLRGGAGIFYTPVQISQPGGLPQPPGYSASTPFVGTLDGGLTVFRTLSNPFPDGLQQPARDSAGASTFLGQNVSFFASAPRMPYVVQWNFDVQHQLPGGYLVDVAYTASRGVKLNQGREYNQLPPDVLSLGSALQQLVPNPFYGAIQVGALALPTVARQQLLRPYPQFTGVYSPNEGSANSIYHALNLKVERRFSAGVGFLVSYTAGKLISDWQNGLSGFGNPLDNGLNSTTQNWSNLRAERSISEMDIAQSLIFSGVAELPFGKGRRLLSGWKGIPARLVDGWDLSGVFTYRSGFPLIVTAPGTLVGNRPNTNGKSAKIDGSRSRNEEVNRWFDTSTLTAPPPFTFGNIGRTLPDVRGPSMKNVDVSLIKNNRIRERMSLQLRLESFNAFNRPHLWMPNTAVGNVQFGRISTTTSQPRVNQVAVKLLF